MEERIKRLEMQVHNLQLAFDSMSRSQTTTVGRVDDTSNKVVAITPYTQTKTAYIGDTECVFTNVPSGNMSVFVNASDGSCPKFGAVRSEDVVIVSFEELETTATVTISIM